MKKGKLFRHIAMLICLVMLITSTIGTTYGFVTISTSPLVNIFVPDDIDIEGIVLNKTVEHPLGQGYKIPENISFGFLVELGAYYAHSKINTTLGDVVADGNGSFEITLKPGEALGIQGLREGTVVTVTEKDTTLPGFSPKGEKTQTLTVRADGDDQINFVNKYQPKPVSPTNVTVKGLKVLEGRDWYLEDEFTFKLEQKKGDRWTDVGTKTITYTDENVDFDKFDFTDLFHGISFTQVGTYHFRMSEVKGELADISYDETVNYFDVLVTDVDMDGKLEVNTITGNDNAKVSSNQGTFSVFVTFNNTYVPIVLPDPEPLTVPVEIVKKVNNVGDMVHGPEGFEFVLENVDTGEKTFALSDERGNASFPLTFTKADIGKTYTYTLSETNQKKTGMTYDADVYKISIKITLNEDNRLVAEISMDGQSVKILRFVFKNTYDAKKTDGPQSGDRSHLTLWIVMMIVSGTSLVALLLHEGLRKKKSS